VVRVKICGLTNLEDAASACDHGADLVGFVFAEVSPRAVGAETVREIVSALPAGVGKAGLFKDSPLEEVAGAAVACGLDHIQLHGGESPEYCRELKEALSEKGLNVKIIKTFKVKDNILGRTPGDFDSADYYLFDTFHPDMMGGTGISFDWSVLEGFKWDRPFFLAGGLTPGNVAEAVRVVRPYGVDVSSGVEASTGKKDGVKIKEFIKNAKDA